MPTIKIIDPVTRLEGHLKIKVSIDTVNGKQQVVDSWASGTMFRGFEKILIGRHPWDAQHITQRICGVCPVPHGMAAVLALDRASGITPPENARIMRNLVLGANFIDSHILHFYHLALPDYINGPNMPPWQPSWAEDRRFDASTSAELVKHYVTALDFRRKAHEMGALFGGKMPHPPSYIPGGFTTTPTAERISRFKAYLSEIIPFIRDIYIAFSMTTILL
jgi:hydrogenase large subunit